MAKPSKPKLPKVLRNRLRGTQDTFEVVSNSRPTLSKRQLQALADQVALNTTLGRPAFPYIQPRTIETLRKDDRSLRIISLDSEIWWTAALLSHHTKRLNVYLRHKRQIESALWRQDYTGVLATLAALDDESGVSLWAIEQRLAVLQIAEGLPAQKAYSRLIRSKRNNEDSVAYIAFHSSIRNENTTQIFSFVEHFSDRIRTNVDDPDFTAWLIYRICDKWEMSEASVATLLRVEHASSFIDIYETFLRLALRSVTQNSVGTGTFLEASKALADVNDPRLQRLSAMQKRLQTIYADAHAPAVANAYFSDDFETAMRLGDELIAAGRPDTSSLEYQSRSLARLTDESHHADRSDIHPVVFDLQRLFAQKFESDAFLSLAKLAMNLRFTSLPATFEDIMWDQVSPFPTTSSQSRLFSFLGSPWVSGDTVISSGCLDSTAIEELRVTSLTIAERVALERISPLEGSTDGPDPPGTLGETLLLNRYTYLSSRSWESVLLMPTFLLASSDILVRRQSRRLFAAALIATEDVHGAAGFIVGSVLGDDALRFQLPVKQVCDKFTKAYRKSHAADLTTSILLDIVCRFDESKQTIRAYAYEDFLHSQGLERPSQLGDRLNSFDSELLLYYLKNLCKPEILERSLAFRGTSQVEDERIAVCALLVALDPKNRSSYEEETRALSQRQVIRRGVRRIEESKIFVDNLGLGRWADKNLRESFSRYKALREAGMDVGELDLVNALKQTLAEADRGFRTLELPTNEAVDLMITMLRKLTQEYLTNPEYGLDYYLSMRIRHGAFSGQLRAPLEAQNIVTQRASDTGDYKSNTHWRNVLFDVEPAEWLNISNALGTFTRSFDEIVKGYAHTYLHVYSADEKPGGLFRVPITTVFVALISTHISSDADLSDFVDASFEYLESALDNVLSDVRNHIDQVLSVELSEPFRALESVLAQTTGPQAKELDSALRAAQTALATSLVQLKSWFYRSESTEVPDWTFEQLVQIGLVSVTKMHERFEPNLVLQIPPLPRLVNLALFADIFFIVFDNIRVHSGLTAPQVTVMACLEEGKLRVTIRNDVAERVLTEERRLRVDDIRLKVEQGGFGFGARREGGSGLMKLRNRIRVAEEDATEFHFGLLESHSFTVEFAIPVYYVKRQEQM